MKQANGRFGNETGAAAGAPESSHGHEADRRSNPPARRQDPDKPLLERILDTPHLARVVPQLQPELLHKVIQTCGLEDCGQLVALATAEQLTRVFDLDLWRSSRAGRAEQFDADRFAIWLEVLLESGADVAAHKLSEIAADLVTTGLAQHVLVYDRGAASRYTTLDGEEMEPVHGLEDAVTSDIVVAKRDEARNSWDAIVAVLMSLAAEHPDYFEEVMSGCLPLSNAAPEIDGLDDLLGDREQAMFDVGIDREQRQERQGYVTPAQARAFLATSRSLKRDAGSTPPTNPLARAYFRAIAEPAVEDSLTVAVKQEAQPSPQDAAEASTSVAEVLEILRDAGVVGQQPRALLTTGNAPAGQLSRIQSHMQFLADRDSALYSQRSQELAYLANTIMSGCSIQSRPLTPQEASDAVVAVCNLGLENWPPHWNGEQAVATSPGLESGTAAENDFLVRHDLVTAFQVGWSVLYKDVAMFVAEQLIDVLYRLDCEDEETRAGLVELRVAIARQWRDGTPWRARDALDVIASLDMPAWAALLALVDELPVIHAGLKASLSSRTRSVGASDFEFISENSQLASIRTFVQSLPEILAR
jgi:hypothetical protein